MRIDDTQELPAVRARRTRSVPTILGVFFGVAVLALIGTAAVVFFTAEDAADTSTSIDTGDDGSIPDADTTDDATPAGGDPPEVETLPNENAGLWKVVGADRLNVRAGPGTSSPVIGSLAGGDRGIAATGERASVNGGEWKRIVFGGDGNYGWVAAGYLAPDTGEPDPAATPAPTETAEASEVADGGAFESRLERGPACFLRETGARRTAIHLELDGAQQVTGVLRQDNGSNVVFTDIAGAFTGADVVELVLTETGTTSERAARWTYNGGDVVLTDGIRVAGTPCVDVDPLLS